MLLDYTTHGYICRFLWVLQQQYKAYELPTTHYKHWVQSWTTPKPHCKQLWFLQVCVQINVEMFKRNSCIALFSLQQCVKLSYNIRNAGVNLFIKYPTYLQLMKQSTPSGSKLPDQVAVTNLKCSDLGRRFSG